MDPPPPQFAPATDSANSSPRSRHDSTWDDNSSASPLPAVPGSNKLRLMCSYGGHIIPRPHDKSLCYVGGDTRIVVVDRHCSFADFHSRLSHSLLNGRHFTLKYQLPSEDLDSLISLASDEDLDNMIDEYDRSSAAASPLKPARLRLFLFPSMPETAASMGSLLDDAKSETWFVDALNGSGLLPRGLSDSAAANDTLLELDNTNTDHDHSSIADPANRNDGKAAPAKSSAAQEVAVETSSSFGSSSSSPSMANLPPIRVRSEEYMMVQGLDEQFSSNLSIAAQNMNMPPVPFVNIPAAAVKSGDRDDERSEKSDHGTVAPSGLRKPPLPLQPVQRKMVDVHNLPSPDSKHAGGYNLPSPDSVASDGSIASSGSQAKHAIYHDATQNSTRENQIPTGSNGQTQDPVPVPVPVPVPSQQWSQQQYIPTTTHYIHHQHQHTPMQPPVSSYYPMYVHHQTPPPPQQNDHQYPVYLMSPATQPSYDASSRPLTPPLPPTKTEMAAAAPMMVQVPPHQFQQHYIGVSQMQPSPNQNAPATAAAGGGNYGYDQYSYHLQEQAYYAQQMAASSAPPPPPPSQYQTMTPATAVMFSQASSQMKTDCNQQHS